MVEEDVRITYLSYDWIKGLPKGKSYPTSFSGDVDFSSNLDVYCDLRFLVVKTFGKGRSSSLIRTIIVHERATRWHNFQNPTIKYFLATLEYLWAIFVILSNLCNFSQLILSTHPLLLYQCLPPYQTFVVLSILCHLLTLSYLFTFLRCLHIL